MSDYKITQEDIEGVHNYLKIFDPKNANMTYAEDLMHYIVEKVHRIGLNDPAALHELNAAYQKEQEKDAENGE